DSAWSSGWPSGTVCRTRTAGPGEANSMSKSPARTASSSFSVSLLSREGTTMSTVSADASATGQPDRARPRVLIVEDDAAAASIIKRELERRGCACVLMVLPHEPDFEAEFERMYPPGEPVRPEYVFQGTVLDVMFKKLGDVKQKEGG